MSKKLFLNKAAIEGIKHYEVYRREGGYKSVEKAFTMTEAEIVEEVKKSGLRGRGGAGFPTGLKWSFIAKPEGVPRHLVVNADESEPGTFKDRYLMEFMPHYLLEGMIVSSFALGSNVSYIYIRGEYDWIATILEVAIEEAKQNGWLGKNIQGSGFDCEIYVHRGAGAYICGEETALIESLEGKRGNPRIKPPFPAVQGVWQRPTVVNNVETISNVSHIIGNGADWFRSLGRGENAGTKIYGISGRVQKPGAWELPMGITGHEILQEYGGGMQAGYKLRAIIPGGASTEFILPEQLETPMDFESMSKIGTRLGTGNMILLDDHTCPIGMMENLEHFFAQESCGWCTPCWAGLSWIDQILIDIEAGKGKMEDIEILASHARLLGPGHTFCALAPGAAEPLQSGLKLFREDFEQHIREQRCPWR